MPTSRTLLVLGSGPGIGVAVASRFAQEHFDCVAIFARTGSQLQLDQDAIHTAVQKVGREVVVKAWQVDISNIDQLKAALKQVESFGTIECVYFNPARVGGSNFFDFPTEEMISDFQISVIALYVTAQWAVPLLLRTKEKNPGLDYKPSILVTSSLLPVDPIPELFSLSLVKAAQANMVKSLEKMFKARGIHIGMVIVGGMVSPDATTLNPTNIAQRAWELFQRGELSDVTIL
ncbi:hypothetical protein BDW72DRAFT_209507 [Aspergillus terricola var. indicus]